MNFQKIVAQTISPTKNPMLPELKDEGALKRALRAINKRLAEVRPGTVFRPEDIVWTKLPPQKPTRLAKDQNGTPRTVPRLTDEAFKKFQKLVHETGTVSANPSDPNHTFEFKLNAKYFGKLCDTFPDVMSQLFEVSGLSREQIAKLLTEGKIDVVAAYQKAGYSPATAHWHVDYLNQLPQNCRQDLVGPNKNIVTCVLNWGGANKSQTVHFKYDGPVWLPHFTDPEMEKKLGTIDISVQNALTGGYVDFLLKNKHDGVSTPQQNADCWWVQKSGIHRSSIVPGTNSENRIFIAVARFNF